MQEKSCLNCAYYVQHYVKNKTRFHKISYGHCIHDKKRKSEAELCKYWELNDTKIEDIKEPIIGKLSLMCNQINEMIQILKEPDQTN